MRLVLTLARTASGIRYYSEDDLSRLRFIRRAKEPGFSLKDIHTLLRLDEKDCDDVLELAKRKLADIHKHIAGLESMVESLTWIIHESP